MPIGLKEIEALGTYQNPDVRDAMVICGIALTFITAAFAYASARRRWRPRARWVLILIYLIAPLAQGSVGHSIANARAPENSAVGLWLSMGAWYDILITLSLAPVFAMIVGLISYRWLKRSRDGWRRNGACGDTRRA